MAIILGNVLKMTLAISFGSAIWVMVGLVIIAALFGEFKIKNIFSRHFDSKYKIIAGVIFWPFIILAGIYYFFKGE